VLDANSRFKYSNHGYGLAGLVIEAVTGEPYADWIKRAIIAPAGLRETEPDAPLGSRVPMARGHSAKLPLGRRVIIPGLNPTRALAPATGFVSTARDLTRFFAQLDPAAKRSVLSAAATGNAAYTSSECPTLCPVAMIRGCVRSGLSPRVGSCSHVSIAAPAIHPSRRACSKAAS
jgi:CubicO group peptidase (beta-lactamase class C family)